MAMLAFALLTLLSSSQPPLLFSSNLGGDVVSGCHGERDPAFAAVASLADEGVLYFDAGDLLGTSYAARVLVRERLPEFVALLQAQRLKALALGHRDLAGDRETLLAAAHAFTLAGFPYVASNLACKDPALCRATVPTAPLSTTTVLLAAISPAAGRALAGDRRAGFVLTDPVEAIRTAAAAARAIGAERIIAVYDPAPQNVMADALDFAARLQGAADLVIVRGTDKRFVAATLRGGVIALGASGGVTRYPEAARSAVPDADFAARSRALNDWLCNAHAHALPPLHHNDFADFADLTLDVMRESGHAEVAVLNPHGMRDDDFPLPVAATELDIRSALPFDDHLRIAWVKGADLRRVYQDSGERLFFRGVDKVGSALKVNGRPLDDASWYRIVTTDFLADGGDGVRIAPTFYAVGSAPLPELVLRKLRGSQSELALARHTRWWIHYTLELDLASTLVSNPSPTILNDAQLSRGQALAVTGDSLFRAFADHPVYSLENTLHLQYGVSRTIDVTGVNSGLVNNIDLIAGRTTGIYRRVFGEPRWYLPTLYADMYIESEFTRPDTRPYQHLLLQPTAGARLELNPCFSLYVGGGLGWEALAHRFQMPPPATPVYPVFVTGWALRPTTLIRLGERAITAESNLDIYWVEWLGVPSTQVRFRGRIAVPIFGIVSLTATDEVFAHYLKTGVTLWGYSNDLTAGIQVAYDRAFQSFHL
jgi:hypothetical protein